MSVQFPLIKSMQALRLSAGRTMRHPAGTSVARGHSEYCSSSLSRTTYVASSSSKGFVIGHPNHHEPQGRAHFPGAAFGSKLGSLSRNWGPSGSCHKVTAFPWHGPLMRPPENRSMAGERFALMTAGGLSVR
jgi:hypothetical protein